MLTQSELKSLLDYDPLTGLFMRAGKVVGSIHQPRWQHRYVRISVGGELHYAHRLAWLYMTGEWPKLIDHIDRDGLNNRFSNLRPATRAQNGANARCNRNNRTRLKGVERRGRRYRARLGSRDLGSFSTAAEAHQAYVTAAREKYGHYHSDGLTTGGEPSKSENYSKSA